MIPGGRDGADDLLGCGDPGLRVCDGDLVVGGQLLDGLGSSVCQQYPGASRETVADSRQDLAGLGEEA